MPRLFQQKKFPSKGSIGILSKRGTKITHGHCPEFWEAVRLAGELGTIKSAEVYVEHEEILSCDKRKKVDD